MTPTRTGEGHPFKLTDLKSAIQYLEDTYPVGQDNTWSGQKISSTHTHHLDDLAHHPTLLGLVSAIMVQFFRISIFASKDGKLHPRVIETSIKDLTCWVPIILSGVLKWLTYLAQENEVIILGEDVPKPIQELVKNIHKAPAVIQILSVADNWFSHLVSDMGGSKNTPGGGTGIPGLFLSLLKEISMLPGVKNSNLPQILNDLYRGTKNSPLTSKLDLRTEITVVKQQSLPIIMNEVIVRTFFFVRHLVSEYKKQASFDGIDWHNVVPFANRTVERMMTIASGTFTAVDIADAAIRSGGFNAACLLRVNFVGVGRFAISIVTDTSMGVKRSKLQNERYSVIGQHLDLLNTKVYYLYASAQYEMGNAFDEQSKLWIAADDTVTTLMEANETVVQAIAFYAESLQEIQTSLDKISSYLSAVEQKNPGLTEEMLNTIRWGKS